MKHGPVRIVGGGLSGLTTAILLARGGAGVEVFERRPASAKTPMLRFDAAENWTTPEDFRALLASWSIDPSPFQAPASIDVRSFDGESYRLTHDRPLVYLVRRGGEPGCLEHSLARQALDLGVRIRHGESLPREQADVWAAGTPRRGFFLDVTLTFRTSSSDRVVVLVDRRLTPKAFAYLIVIDGVGTLAVLLTRQFKRARALLAETVDAFQRMQPVDMRDVRLRSGFGGAAHALDPRTSAPLVIGEAAGFLDYLWGFGIRHAMLSGTLAARALLEGVDFEALVAREIRPLVQTSLINRRFYDYAHNPAYRALIRYFCARDDLHGSLRRFYRSRGARSVLWPWAKRAFIKQAP
jgi:flavin-dependent dehydrogenase